MYVKSRGLGRLGQTAATYFTANQQVSLQFSLDGAASVWFETNSFQSIIPNLLSSWAPFSSGAFSNPAVMVDNPSQPLVLTVTFMTGANAPQYTYGLLAQSIAQTINASMGGTVSPVGLGPGLASALPTATAAVQALTINPQTLLQSWENIATGQNVNAAPPASTTSTFPWGMTLLVIAALALVWELA
jgi:hypothetical protein